MPNGLDDLERQAQDRRSRRTRQPPPPRNPRNQDSTGSDRELAPVPTVEAAIAVAIPSGAAAIAAYLPRPYQGSDSGDLTTTERTDREKALAVLKLADAMFWVQGKALELVREGRLYKDTHSSFDAFCVDMDSLGGRRRADQLIEVWELAEKIAEGPGKIFPGFSLNEAQVRALKPLAARHGDDAALHVYELVLRSDRKVTAALLKQVVELLPEGHFDKDEVERLVIGHLAANAGVVVTQKEQRDSASVLNSELGRVELSARRIAQVAQQDPGALSQFIDQLTKLLEELRELQAR